MTLAEVLAHLKEARAEGPDTPLGDRFFYGIDHAIECVETDPDFTLRERIEKLTKVWAEDACPVTYMDAVRQETYEACSRSLREILKGKK